MTGHLTRILCALALSSAHAAASQRKIYAAGSGLDMLSQPDTVQEVIALSGKIAPKVLYLGTATYDEPGAKATQTAGFAASGCAIESLDVAWINPPDSEFLQVISHCRAFLDYNF